MDRQTDHTLITQKHFFYVTIFVVCLILPIPLFTEYYYLPFAIVAAIIIGALIIFRPFIGLIIYSVFLFIRPQEFISALMNSPVPVERSIALMLIISVLLRHIRNGLRYKFSRIDYSMIAFILICLLSILGSIYISHSLDTWMRVLRLFIIYMLIIQLIESKRQMKIYILFIIFSSVFHAFASVINYYQGNFISNVAMNIDRAVGIDQSFSGPNSLAATLVYTLPFIYYYYISEHSKFIKTLLVAVTPGIILCIILTGSRTGMAGVIFFILLLIWQGRNKLRNAAIAVLVLTFIWVVMPGQYQDRFSSTIDLSSGSASANSAMGRVNGLVKGAKMAIDRPLTGYGIGSYATASATIYSIGDWHEAHSLPGQLLGELGLLGTASFIIWIYLLLKTIGRLVSISRLRKERFYYLTLIGLKIQLFCLFFLGLAGHNLYRYNWYVISALIVVMMKPSFLGFAEGDTDSEQKQEPPTVTVAGRSEER